MSPLKAQFMKVILATKILGGKVFENCDHFSVTMPDRSLVTIVHRLDSYVAFHF